MRHSLLEKKELGSALIDNQSDEITFMRCHKDNFNYVAIGYLSGCVEIRKTGDLKKVEFCS